MENHFLPSHFEDPRLWQVSSDSFFLKHSSILHNVLNVALNYFFIIGMTVESTKKVPTEMGTFTGRSYLNLGVCVLVCTHTHTHTRARAHTRAHTHKHMHKHTQAHTHHQVQRSCIVFYHSLVSMTTVTPPLPIWNSGTMAVWNSMPKWLCPCFNIRIDTETLGVYRTFQVW